MSSKKMYSAFISSVYESLKDERSEVIDCLLDFNVFPICMEHFTTAADRKFKDIEERIDDADFFILILGSRYGSLDENGISWTEREYVYAKENNKPMLVLFCDELISLRSKRHGEGLTEDERRQIKFSDEIGFARSVTEELTIRKIITQFLTGYDFSALSGWIRDKKFTPREIEEWRETHKAFHIEGEWFHAHIAPDDPKYIRTGTMKISQRFDPENYKNFTFEGLNYSVRYNAASGELFENRLKRTHWSGTYSVDEKGVIFGIFMAKREFSENFGEYSVERGIRRGIHDFVLDVGVNEEPTSLQGEFHDEAPSPKSGIIYAFRTKAELNEFLKETFMEVLENNK